MSRDAQKVIIRSLQYCVNLGYSQHYPVQNTSLISRWSSSLHRPLQDLVFLPLFLSSTIFFIGLCSITFCHILRNQLTSWWPDIDGDLECSESLFMVSITLWLLSYPGSWLWLPELRSLNTEYWIRPVFLPPQSHDLKTGVSSDGFSHSCLVRIPLP